MLLETREAGQLDLGHGAELRDWSLMELRLKAELDEKIDRTELHLRIY